MTDHLVALIEEEFNLKRIKQIVDRAAADLRWRTESEPEAERRILKAREEVLAVFPEGGDLFDRIYRSRFQRIFKERLVPAIKFE